MITIKLGEDLSADVLRAVARGAEAKLALPSATLGRIKKAHAAVEEILKSAFPQKIAVRCKATYCCRTRLALAMTCRPMKSDWLYCCAFSRCAVEFRACVRNWCAG